jgi:hypothetical protein
MGPLKHTTGNPMINSHNCKSASSLPIDGLSVGPGNRVARKVPPMVDVGSAIRCIFILQGRGTSFSSVVEYTRSLGDDVRLPSNIFTS